jgi:transcriptional regulator with XRE-family HTH domain
VLAETQSLFEVEMIYFVQYGYDGPIKIGYAKNIRNRLAFLQVASPFDLILIGQIEGDRSYERKLHRKFKKSRLTGEWFTPTDDLIEFLGSLPPSEKVKLKARSRGVRAAALQSDLAKATGYSCPMISAILNGSKRPSGKGLLRLKKETGIPFDLWIAGTKEEIREAYNEYCERRTKSE